MKTALLGTWIAAVLVAVGSLGTTQQVVFTGRITDAQTGAALAGARVIAVGHLSTATTDSKGEYRLAVADDGVIGTDIQLRAVLVGYTQDAQTVSVTGPSVTVDFALTRAVVAMDEIVVTATLEAQARERSANQAALPDASAPATLVNRRLASKMAQGYAGERWNLPGRYDPNFQREGYEHLVENAFLGVDANPLSTFSIDVDRASYSNVRRFINQGTRPPIDAVRIEELVNYFTYDLPDPQGDDPFSITTEIADAPWNTAHKLVRIGIQGERLHTSDLPASNLVFLLDVSGSMNSPDKLPLLKSSFRMLANELRPQDRVAIVVYAGAAGLVLPSTSGSEKDAILDAIEQLNAGGSTAGGAGIQLAYKVARENHIRGGNNRIILATDGDFNVGASSGSEMIRLIEEKREQGTFLTVLGFGTGNLQDAKMEKIADHGNGNFAYIDSQMEARKVLVTEMGGTLLTIAKDVKIQVEFNPSRVQSYRLLGYENRILAAEDFNDDTKDAGELGAGHSVTALYEVVPVGVEGTVDDGAVDPLRYQSPRAPVLNATAELLFVKLRYKDPDGSVSRLIEHSVANDSGRPSVDLRFAAAVAGFGMVLRESEHCGDWTLTDVVTLARRSLGRDAEGYRAEFVKMVETAQNLELMATETQ